MSSIGELVANCLSLIALHHEPRYCHFSHMVRSILIANIQLLSDVLNRKFRRFLQEIEDFETAVIGKSFNDSFQ